MSDKTFWAAIGGIIVVWIALFFVLVQPKISEYDEISGKLQRRVSAMKKFASADVNELPTPGLLEKKQRYTNTWENNVEAARRFYEAREQRVTGSIPGNAPAWVARYRDGFDALERRYRQVNEMTDEEALPFERIEDDDPALDLAWAEKMWRVQKFLVEEVLDAGGTVESYDMLTGRNRDGLNKDDPRQNFVLDQVSIKAKLPPARITPHMANVFGHPDLSFELVSCLVGKDPKNLVGDIVVAPEDAPEGEPPVVLEVSWNILTYAPAEPEE